jgi:hypothetical protein
VAVHVRGSFPTRDAVAYLVINLQERRTFKLIGAVLLCQSFGAIRGIPLPGAKCHTLARGQMQGYIQRQHYITERLYFSSRNQSFLHSIDDIESNNRYLHIVLHRKSCTYSACDSPAVQPLL